MGGMGWDALNLLVITDNNILDSRDHKMKNDYPLNQNILYYWLHWHLKTLRLSNRHLCIVNYYLRRIPIWFVLTNISSISYWHWHTLYFVFHLFHFVLSYENKGLMSAYALSLSNCTTWIMLFRSYESFFVLSVMNK